MNPQHQEAQDAAQTMTDAIKLPELPEHLMIYDEADDSQFGSLVEHAWDSDYSMKVGDPMFTADQMRAYARAAIQADRAEMPSWRDLAYAQLGRFRDEMSPDHVDAVQRFLREEYAALPTPPDHTEALRLCREALRNLVKGAEECVQGEWGQDMSEDMIPEIVPARAAIAAADKLLGDGGGV